MKLDFDEQYINKDNIAFICGSDEAGRGCLLGPVFAGAVILPKGYKNKLINDSKKLNEKQRNLAYEEIIKDAIAWGVAFVTPEEIDKINILNASRLAMIKAIENMNHNYDLLLTDCMKMPLEMGEFISLVHGDARSQSIAAASIIAKVNRDRWCYQNCTKFPQFHIDKNKGYGTKDHLEALEKYGPVKGLHRFSYKPVINSINKNIKLF